MAAIVRKTLYPDAPIGRFIQSWDMHYKIYNASRESEKDDPAIAHRVLPHDKEEHIAISSSDTQRKLFDLYVRIGYTVAEAQERANCDLEGFTHPVFM